jgi:hypothetical protein
LTNLSWSDSPDSGSGGIILRGMTVFRMDRGGGGCQAAGWTVVVSSISVPYLDSRMKVGTMPAAEEKPVFPVESQLEQPCTLPR